MPRIPGNLQPITAAYSYEGPGGALRTEVEGGANRYALDYDRGVQPFSVTLILTALEHQVWSYFYYNQIKKGTISFEMPLDSGMGLSDHTVNIVPGSYNVVSNGAGVWSVRFIVEATSQVYDDPESGEALIELYNAVGNNLNNIFDALEYFATNTSNVLDF